MLAKHFKDWRFLGSVLSTCCVAGQGATTSATIAGGSKQRQVLAFLQESVGQAGASLA